jgi:hypothetical protein
MTVQSILNRAALLMGAQPASPNAPAEERLRMALDSALGELSRAFPLQARCRITVSGGSAPLPANVLTPRALLKEGRRIPLHLEEGMILAEDGVYTLVYYRIPPLGSQMELSDQLPYPEDLLLAVPFYCAALCVVGEDPALYTQLMEQYNTKIASALGYRPAAEVEAGGSL